jgi:hypothetical protein
MRCPESVAHAGYHRGLADAPSHGHGGRKHIGAGLLCAHDFQQAHDIRRAEKVQAEHIAGPFREAGNDIHIQRRRVAGENGARFATRSSSRNTTFLISMSSNTASMMRSAFAAAP